MKLLLTALLSLSTICFGQSFVKSDADSLRKELENPDLHDTNYVSYKVLLGEKLLIFRTGYWDSLAQETVQRISRNHDTTVVKRLARSYSVITNNLGYLFNVKGDFEKAIYYYDKCMIYKRRLDDKNGMALALNNLGALNAEIENYEIAKDYFDQSLVIYEETGHKRGLAQTYNNISTIIDELGATPEEELYYLRKSYSIRNEIGDYNGIAKTAHNLGKWHEDHGEIDSAEFYLLHSLEIYDSMQNLSGLAMSNNSLGKHYFERNLSAKAKPFIKKGLEYSEQAGDTKRILNSAHSNYLLAEKEKNWKRAFDMYYLYDTMSDSLSNLDNVKLTTKQKYQFEYDKKVVADSVKNIEQAKVQKAKFETLEAQNEKRRQQAYFLYGGLGVVGIFAFFMFNRFRITKKQKVIIEDQKEKVDLAYDQLEEKNNEILDSIAYAKRIQSAILPPDKLVKEYLDQSFVLYKPKDIVAGDFYWMENAGDKILFAAADCTGHGVPGAMVSVVCNNGLNRSVREYGLTDPGEILDQTREIVIQEFEKSEDEVKDGMDIALCSLEDRTLSFAGAHNSLWIIRKGAQEIEEHKADKQPIGKFDVAAPFTTHKTELNEGDTFYIFSDGFADQFGGEKGKKFKASNFKKLLLEVVKESMPRQKELIDQTFEDWKGPLEQLDDVCVIGVRV